MQTHTKGALSYFVCRHYHTDGRTGWQLNKRDSKTLKNNDDDDSQKTVHFLFHSLWLDYH